MYSTVDGLPVRAMMRSARSYLRVRLAAAAPTLCVLAVLVGCVETRDTPKPQTEPKTKAAAEPATKTKPETKAEAKPQTKAEAPQ